MPDSVTSVFSESEDFETALRKEGCLGMVTTGRGQFRAQLTQVALYRLHLSAGEEQLSRIGFVAAPPDMIMISFPTGAAPSLIWAGIRMPVPLSCLRPCSVLDPASRPTMPGRWRCSPWWLGMAPVTRSAMSADCYPKSSEASNCH